jgi:hypothetical protein
MDILTVRTDGREDEGPVYAVHSGIQCRYNSGDAGGVLIIGHRIGAGFPKIEEL